jgi:hypothetical protein
MVSSNDAVYDVAIAKISESVRNRDALIIYESVLVFVCLKV